MKTGFFLPWEIKTFGRHSLQLIPFSSESCSCSRPLCEKQTWRRGNINYVGGGQTNLAETHDSYRVPNTMHIIHLTTTEPLAVWHLHFICILELGWFWSQISFFDKLLCQKWVRFAFSLSHSDSGCVGRETVASSDRKPFVTDDWVNRLVLINILIGALPSWTFAFFLFSQLSPLVSVLFWLRDRHTKTRMAGTGQGLLVKLPAYRYYRHHFQQVFWPHFLFEGQLKKSNLV